MRLTSPQTRFKAYAKSLGSAKYEAPTGFADNWSAAMKITMNEDMSYSRSAVTKEAEAERTKTLMGYHEDGTIPDEIFSNFQNSGVEYKGLKDSLLAEYANKNLNLKDVKTDEEIYTSIRKSLKGDRDTAQNVFQNATYGGMLARFLAPMSAMLLDPVYIPTYFIGIGAAAKGAQILSIAAKVAAAESTMELVKQSNVYGWKADIGVDYSIREAATQVAIAAGVAGGVTAGIGAVSLGLKTLVKKGQVKAHVENVAVQSVKDSIDEISHNPDPKMEIGKHSEIVEGENTHQLNRNYAVSKEAVETTRANADVAIDEEQVKAFETLIADDPEALVVTGREIVTPEGNISETVNAKSLNDVFAKEKDEVMSLMDCVRAGLI